MQGTNAHAVTEVLQLDLAASILGRTPQASWRRTPFWLLPPLSPLLSACLAGSGQGGGVRLEGLLFAPAVAAAGLLSSLVLPSGEASTLLSWTAAVWAASAACGMLALSYDGKEPRQHVLAAASLTPCTGLAADPAARLTVVIGAAAGSAEVAVRGRQAAPARVLSAEVRTPSQMQGSVAEGQQQHSGQAPVSRATWLRLGSKAAGAEGAATGALIDHWPAGLEPQLRSSLWLEACSQLQCAEQLGTAAPATEGSLAPCVPVGFGALLSSSRHSGSGLQHLSATRNSLHSAGDTGSAELHGYLTRRLGLQKPSASGSSDTSGTTSSDRGGEDGVPYYSIAWHAAQPMQPSEQSLQLQGAMFSMASTGSKLDCSLHRTAAAGTACYGAMQLLQSAAGGRVGSVRLVGRAADPAAGQPSDPASADGLGLAAMLRCAACELTSVRMATTLVTGSAALLPKNDDDTPAHGQLLSMNVQHAAKMLEHPKSRADPVSPFLQHIRSWVVSGGTGALGWLATRWLAGTAAVRMVLLGRSPRLAAGTAVACLEAAVTITM